MLIGKVYKIIHNQSDIVYIGSTLGTIAQRWQNHKRNYQNYLKEKHSGSIYPYFEQFGIENFKIILIKEYEVVDRRHLCIYEQLWIHKTRCCNSISAFKINRKDEKFYLKKFYPNSVQEAQIERKKQQSRDYYQKNKQKIKERAKEWVNNNKDEIKERMKEYRIRNKDKLKKDKIKEYKQQYSIDNREKIKQQKRQYYLDNKAKFLKK
jgi:hypothetical protein